VYGNKPVRAGVAGQVRAVATEAQPGGWADWKLWSEVCAEHSPHEMIRQGSRDILRMLDIDQGDLLTFALVTAVRSQ
jgi:hypothetical protein